MGRYITFLFILICTCLQIADAQLSPLPYSSPNAIYTQGFDGLPATGSFAITGKGPIGLSSGPINAANLSGWQFWMNAGSNTNAVFAPGTGSSTGNGIYSLGISGSSDRALGSLSASTGIYSFGLILTNTTGMALNNCTISFITEQWRRGGSGNRNTWSFRYKTGTFNSIDQTGCSNETGLDMSSVISSGSGTSLNGNLPENRQQVSFTLQHINWKNGEQLLLRWDDADESGSDDVCALDSFSFKAWQTVAAPTAAALPATAVSASAATLNGTVNDQFATTTVFFEYDTAAGFTHPLSLAASPDTISQGMGSIAVSANLSGLLTGVAYYCRVKAINTAGTVYSNTISFTTSFGLPVLTTLTPAGISPNAAVLGGSISHTGGLPITEQGVIWSLSNAGNGTTVTMRGGSNAFSSTVPGLPPASTIYTKAYAVNNMGTAYGEQLGFITPTLVTALSATDALYSNAGTVHFNLVTAQNISGLSAANFALTTEGVNGASISSVTGSGNRFTITATTGTGDGNIALRLINDNNLSVPVYNKPFIASSVYRIDKTPPLITQVIIPNTSMKLGDTVPTTIFVRPDTAVYKLQSGKINNLSLGSFNKKNDSLYTANFIISSSASNIAAEAPMPVNIVLTDAAGNSNTAYQTPITQSSDAIDAIRPFITEVKLPPDGLYKTRDSLVFLFRFNEKVAVTNLAVNSGFSSTIGSRTKLVVYTGGNGTDSLVFRYLIPPGDADNDGIRINSPVPLVNMEIRDLAGNPATLSYTFPSTKNILVDAVAPAIIGVVTPAAAAYRTGNLLDFLVSFNEKVWISDSEPSLGLVIGNNTRTAVYTSGSGSTSWLFRYMIVDDDMDKDGIKLVSPLNASMAPKDMAGNTASVVLSNIGALSGVLVNPPNIAAIGLLLPADSIYRNEDTLEFELQFNENAFVDTRNGTPALKLTVGTTTRQALYKEGSGSNTLLFSYAIQKNETDSDGIRISSSLSLNNGSITDEKGNAIPLTLNGIGNTSNIRVDAADPVVKNLVTPAKGIYATGDTLHFVVNFSEQVFIRKMDSLFLKIDLGNGLRQAVYVHGDSTSSFLFRYIVAKDDLDKNGIRIDSLVHTSNSLLCDRAGNKLVATLASIGALSGVKVDGIAPGFLEQGSSITVCANATDLAIGALLAVSDKEDDEALTWQLISTNKGMVSKQIFTGTSNGKTVTPSAIFYRPAADAQGIDSVIAMVSDGVYTSKKQIMVNILPSISHNETGGTQMICAGNIPGIISGSVPMGGNGVYAYQWETATVSEATGFNKAPGNSTQSFYAPGKLNNNTWFRRKVFSGGCQDVSTPIQMMVLKNGLWTGNYSDQWNNPNNWCNGSIPDQTTEVLINPDTKFDPVIADTASCYRLQLNANTRLTIAGQLKLKTNIQNNNGLIDATNGTIILNGTELQSFAGDAFNNNTIKDLFVNNPAGVVFTAALRVNGSIVLNNGTLITNGQLRLLAGSFIGPSALGTAIKGKISIEKRIRGKAGTYRLLGHPFYETIPLSMISDSTRITGEGGVANGFAASPGNAPSAFYFNPSANNDPQFFDSAWIGFRHTNGLAENAWHEFAGIRLWVPDIAQLLFSGVPHHGKQELQLPNTATRAFQVVSNPYPAPIEMSRLGRGTGIGNHYWIWDPRQGMQGGYTSIPFSDLHTLDPFEAFIVRKDSNGGPLLFTENCKAAAYTKDSLPPVHTDVTNFIELRLETDSIFWDRILLMHSDNSGSYYDTDDAEKIWNKDLNFYSISRDNQFLSIDARPISNASIIPLGMNTTMQQGFRIRVAALRLSPDNTLQLHDKWLGKWTKLEKDSSYAFNTTSDTLSTRERFEIASFRAKPDTGVLPKLIVRIAPVPAQQNTIVSFSAPEKKHTLLRLLSATGVPIRQVDLGVQQQGQYLLSLTGILSGFYFVEVNCGEQTVLQKLIKQ